MMSGISGMFMLNVLSPSESDSDSNIFLLFEDGAGAVESFMESFVGLEDTVEVAAAGGRDVENTEEDSVVRELAVVIPLFFLIVLK